MPGGRLKTVPERTPLDLVGLKDVARDVERLDVALTKDPTDLSVGDPTVPADLDLGTDLSTLLDLSGEGNPQVAGPLQTLEDFTAEMRAEAPKETGFSGGPLLMIGLALILNPKVKALVDSAIDRVSNGFRRLTGIGTDYNFKLYVQAFGGNHVFLTPIKGNIIRGYGSGYRVSVEAPDGRYIEIGRIEKRRDSEDGYAFVASRGSGLRVEIIRGGKPVKEIEGSILELTEVGLKDGDQIKIYGDWGNFVMNFEVTGPTPTLKAYPVNIDSPVSFGRETKDPSKGPTHVIAAAEDRDVSRQEIFVRFDDENGVFVASLNTSPTLKNRVLDIRPATVNPDGSFVAGDNLCKNGQMVTALEPGKYLVTVERSELEVLKDDGTTKVVGSHGDRFVTPNMLDSNGNPIPEGAENTGMPSRKITFVVDIPDRPSLDEAEVILRFRLSEGLKNDNGRKIKDLEEYRTKLLHDIRQYKYAGATEEQLDTLVQQLLYIGFEKSEISDIFKLEVTPEAEEAYRHERVRSALEQLSSSLGGTNSFAIKTIVSMGTVAEKTVAAEQIAARPEIIEILSDGQLKEFAEASGNPVLFAHLLLQSPTNAVNDIIVSITGRDITLLDLVEAEASKIIMLKAAQLCGFITPDFSHGPIVGNRKAAENIAQIVESYLELKEYVRKVQEASLKLSKDSVEELQELHALLGAYGITFDHAGNVTVGLPIIFEARPDDTRDLTVLGGIAGDLLAKKERVDGYASDSKDDSLPSLYDLQVGKGSLAGMSRVRTKSRNIVDANLPPPASGVHNEDIHGFLGYIPDSYPRDAHAETVQMYMVLDPRGYRANIDSVVEVLQREELSGNAAGLFFFKVIPVVQKDGTAFRRDHIVIYCRAEDSETVAQTIKTAQAEVADGDPSFFDSKGPRFAMRIGDGLYMGEIPPEPSNQSAARKSFSEARADAMSLAYTEIQRLKNAGVILDQETETRIVAYFLEKEGIDPEFPAFNLAGRADRETRLNIPGMTREPAIFSVPPPIPPQPITPPPTAASVATGAAQPFRPRPTQPIAPGTPIHLGSIQPPADPFDLQIRILSGLRQSARTRMTSNDGGGFTLTSGLEKAIETLISIDTATRWQRSHSSSSSFELTFYFRVQNGEVEILRSNGRMKDDRDLTSDDKRNGLYKARLTISKDTGTVTSKSITLGTPASAPQQVDPAVATFSRFLDKFVFGQDLGFIPTN